MNLYLIRHGEAKNVGEAGILTDEARALTAKGADEAKQMAAYFQARQVKFDLIVHSPLVRAHQTADYLAHGHGAKTIPDEKLSTAGDIDSYLQVLEAYKSLRTLAVVAHQPTLGKVVLRLIGAEARLGIEFKTCGVAKLTVERHPFGWHGSLAAFFSPEDV